MPVEAGGIRLRAVAGGLLLAGLLSPGMSAAQDATLEQRIKQLEDALKSVTEELKALKEQAAQQAVPAAPAAPAQPGAEEAEAEAKAAIKDAQDKAVAEIKKAQQEAAAAAAQAASAASQATAAKQQSDVELEKAKAEAAAASSQAAELKDRVQTLEQRADQTPSFSLANGLAFSDPRGRWSARFTGRVQGDWRTFDPADAIPDTWSVRRARLGFELTAFKDYLFYLEGEFATGNSQAGTAQVASLTNAYVQFNWWAPQAALRIGQFKPPIGLENSAPDVLTDFMERGLPQNLLQNLNYQRGIMVQGVPYKGLYYGVSWTNGTGINVDNPNTSFQNVQADGGDITARVALNAAPWVKASDSVYHLGGSFKTGMVANGSPGFVAATGRTEAFGTIFFTPQAFNGVGGVTEASNIERDLTAGELALAWKQFKLQSEYWQAQYSGTRITPSVIAFDRSIYSYYVSGFWMITGEAYADIYGGGNATFGRVRPRNNFSWGNGWGAWEVGVRYSVFDAKDFNNNNPQGTGRLGATAPTTVSTNAAQAWTFQVKWILNPYIRFLLDYVQTDFDTPVTANTVTYDTEKAITFRAQADF